MSQAYAPRNLVKQPARVAYVQNKLNGAVYIANEYLSRLPYIAPYHGPIPAPPQSITMKLNSLQTIASQTEAAQEPVQQEYVQPQPVASYIEDHRPPMEGPVPQEVQPWEVPGYWETPQGQAMLSAATHRLVTTHPAEPVYSDPGPALPLDEPVQGVDIVRTSTDGTPVVRRRPPPPRG